MKKIFFTIFLGFIIFTNANAKDSANDNVQEEFNPQKVFKNTCSLCHGKNGLKAPPGGSPTQLIAAMDSEYLFNKLVDYAMHNGGNPKNRFLMYAVMDKYKFSARELKEIAEYISRLGIEQ